MVRRQARLCLRISTLEISPWGGGGLEYNGKIYFAADDGIHGLEFWSTDGTATGTVLLKDINPGVEGSLLGGVAEYNGKLYFSANDGSGQYNRELWVSDGTAAGTYLLKDINPGPDGSTPTEMTIYNGKLYFAVDNNASNYRIWTSDGTSAGTQPLAVPGIYGPQWFVEYKGKLYFSADSDNSSRVLWVTDGTVAGTSIFANIPYPSDFTLFDGKLFMLSDNTEMWVTDGTQTGTHSIVPPGADLPPPFWDPQFFFHSLKVYNDALYFRGCYYSNIGCETYFIPKSLSTKEKVQSQDFSYWPNPFQEKLHIKSEKLIKNVEIFTLNGQRIGLYNPDSRSKTLDLSHLPAGVYFMKVVTGNINNFFKIIKQ